MIMSLIEIILSILAIIGFLGALPQLWGSDWKKIWLYKYKGIISWSYVHKNILKVIENLRKEDFHPNLIIGVGRGGIISSGLLCSELTGEELVESSKKIVSKIHSPQIKLGTINSTIFLKGTIPQQTKREGKKLFSRVDKIELSDVSVEITRNDKILVIVAQNFTGSTLERATKILLKKGVPRDNICTATLFWHKHKNMNIKHEPDIFGTIISIDKTMPWKYHDITTDRY